MGIFDFLKRGQDSSSQPQNVVVDPPTQTTSQADDPVGITQSPTETPPEPITPASTPIIDTHSEEPTSPSAASEPTVQTEESTTSEPTESTSETSS